MKKLMALLLGLMMAFSLVACGDPSGNTGGGGSGGGGGGGDNPIVAPGDDYDPDDPEQYIYRSVFVNSPYKDQWDTSRWGAELDGIWDSSVLPDKIPEKPSSVTEVDRTEYTGKLDEKIGYNPPGGMLSIDYDYDGDVKPWEYYMVMFDGTMDTFNTLVADFEGNFECYDNRADGMGETRFKGDFHAYSTDLYVYMSYQEGGSYNSETYEFEGDGTMSFSIYAIPVHHQLPKLVEGVPLMQVGYVMWTDAYLMCYGEGDEDYTELPYDYQTGTATGTVKEYWGTEFEYYGATSADADAYGTQLMTAGFTRGANESEPYYKIYEKDGIQVVVQHDNEHKYVSVRVQTENWY